MKNLKIIGILLMGLTLTLACTGYDLQNKELLILDSLHTLYISGAKGNNRITLAKNVRNFKWFPEDKEIELVMRSIGKDTVKSKFSIYRFPLDDGWNFYRIGTAGNDTLKMAGEQRMLLK